MKTLPLPVVQPVMVEGIPCLTDDALAQVTGVRVCFSGRAGGVSAGPFASLNLGTHVSDDRNAVEKNRRRLLSAWGASDVVLLNPNQVHGTRIAVVDSKSSLATAEREIISEEGCDGILVAMNDVAALLCFADCVPVILVSPTGDFAVVHAGWRGAAGRIASKAASLLAQKAQQAGEASESEVLSGLNAYIGPHIGGCCFECGQDVYDLFISQFGDVCSSGEHSVDLAQAVSQDLMIVSVQPERIADCGICTQCNSDDYFSYRASGGVCGRHGALAFRKDLS